MSSEGDTSTAASPALMTPQQLRMLRRAVIGMGVVLVLGFALVIGRIVFLLNSPQADVAMPAASPSQPAAALTLPAGAVVKTLSLSGRQLAVHFDGPGGSGIVIVDTGTGAVLQRITIEHDAPRP
jgi:hypothetical protein